MAWKVGLWALWAAEMRFRGARLSGMDTPFTQ